MTEAPPPDSPHRAALAAMLREPFRPFVLRPARGEAVEVHDPADLSVDLNTLCVRVGHDELATVRVADLRAVETPEEGDAASDARRTGH